jgi:putative membrane protein
VPVVTAADAAAIEQRVAEFEARTGVDIVAAVETRSDLYPEVPWRAFALGASLAASAALVGLALFRGWTTPGASLAQAAGIFGAGALAGLVAVLVPTVGRLFAGSSRMRQEVRQRAEVVFLQRELFATPGRNAILVLVSRFERLVVVVADAAYRDRVSNEEWRPVVERMTLPLARGQLLQAFAVGFDAIEELLAAKGLAGGAAGRFLPDELVQGPLPRDAQE